MSGYSGLDRTRFQELRRRVVLKILAAMTLVAGLAHAESMDELYAKAKKEGALAFA